MRHLPSSASLLVPPGRRGTSACRATAWLLSVAGLLVWQLVAAAPAHAAGGDLDPTFGVGGKVITDIAGLSDQAFAVAVQPDGKIVAAGSADEGNGSALQDFALARYTAEGKLDPRFGRRGKVKLDFTGAGGEDEIYALGTQADGKIVAAGHTVDRWALARFTQRGSLDGTFGSGGKVSSHPGQILALAVQADGKLVAAGLSGGSFAVGRYTADGSPDVSFGAGGLVTTDFAGSFAEAHAVALQPDGKIVAAGSVAASAFALARYNLDGSLDPGFGAGGTVTTDFGGAGTAAALVAATAGVLVAAGTADSGASTSHDFVLARYQSDGTLDSSFGTSGKVITSFGGGIDRAEALAVQADGKLVAAGSLADAEFSWDFALARYLAR